MLIAFDTCLGTWLMSTTASVHVSVIMHQILCLPEVRIYRIRWSKRAGSEGTTLVGFTPGGLAVPGLTADDVAVLDGTIDQNAFG